jgi:hypothetical protein
MGPAKGGGSRKKNEQPIRRLSLPENGDRYQALEAPRPGVATMVLFAGTTPLDVADEVVESWFKSLPELPLPAGGDKMAVWLDNFQEQVRDRDRLRDFGVVGATTRSRAGRDSSSACSESRGVRIRGQLCPHRRQVMSVMLRWPFPSHAIA